MEDMKRNGLCTVVMVDRKKGPIRLNHNSQLFRYFPLQTFAEAFTRFLFAPGKLPESFEVAVFGALCHQNLSLFPDQAGRYLKMRFFIFLLHGLPLLTAT